MTPYTQALLIGAVVTALLNYNRPRVFLWIVIGALNFSLTYVYFYHATVLFPHAAVTGLADLGFALLIERYRKEQWELWVRRCMSLSVAVSILFLAGFIPSQSLYASALEGCNWLALLVMGGLSLEALERILGTPSYSRFHRFGVYLRQERRTEGFLARAAA